MAFKGPRALEELELEERELEERELEELELEELELGSARQDPPAAGSTSIGPGAIGGGGSKTRVGIRGGSAIGVRRYSPPRQTSRRSARSGWAGRNQRVGARESVSVPDSVFLSLSRW